MTEIKTNDYDATLLFKEVDVRIAMALKDFSKAWNLQLESNCTGDIRHLFYDGRLRLTKDYIKAETIRAIKENLYQASKLFMRIIVCSVSEDVEKAEKAEKANYSELLELVENSQSDKFPLKLTEPPVLDTKVNTYPTDLESDTYYREDGCAICPVNKNKDSEDTELRIVKFGLIHSYEIPSILRTIIGKKSSDNQKSAEITFLSLINDCCKDYVNDNEYWEEEIYAYIRMLHQMVETAKQGQYEAKQLTLEIEKMDATIIKLEDEALERTIAKLEFLRTRNPKEFENEWKEKILNKIASQKQELEQVKQENEENKEALKNAKVCIEKLIALTIGLLLIIICGFLIK